MAGPGHLVSVHPEELKFLVELEKQAFSDLKVSNNTEHSVAFKIKTTSPNKYFVRPNIGVIQPWDSCVIKVILQAQKEYHPVMQCKDKFLLQSTVVASHADIDELPQDTFNKDTGKTVEECKLRVIYQLPKAAGNSEDEALKGFEQSFSNSSNQNLQRLKDERDSVVWQTQQLQRELEMLKRRRNRNSDAGFSFMFSLLVGLLGIMAGFLLKLTLASPVTE